LASRLGDERQPVHDLGEGGGIARQDAGRSVKCAAKAEPKGKALRLAQRDHLRRTPALRGNVAMVPVDARLVEKRERQVKRVIEPARDGNSLAGARECRVRLAEVREVPRGKAERRDALIRAEHAGVPVVLRRIVQRDRPLAVRERGPQKTRKTRNRSRVGIR